MVNRVSFLTVLASSLLSGCAGISSLPELPVLPYIVQKIPDVGIYSKCARAFPLWQHVVFFPLLPLGCAERFPEHNICIIWVGESSSTWVLEHEKKHCLGFVHW